LCHSLRGLWGRSYEKFIQQGQTVNQAYFMEILKRLHEAVRRKRPELGFSDFILHHDHAPAQKTPSFEQFLAKKNRLLK
jgi:hypothetical protein